MNLNQITLPATDIERSAAFYRMLGFRQIVASPHYARFECPDGDATLSIHLREVAPDDTGVTVYFECVDVDQRVAELIGAGVVFDLLPTDQRWLWREARLRDPAGNVLCLYHAGDNRKFPPWRLADTA